MRARGARHDGHGVQVGSCWEILRVGCRRQMLTSFALLLVVQWLQHRIDGSAYLATAHRRASGTVMLHQIWVGKLRDPWDVVSKGNERSPPSLEAPLF